MAITKKNGFPSLEPALITKLNATGINSIGVTHTGSTLTVFEVNSGSIESVEGFSPAVHADVHFGADWLTFDPDGSHGRLNVKGLAKTRDGGVISFGYVGVIKMNEDVWKIFKGESDMKTVPFGYASGSWDFTVADQKLKELENNMWASSGRIVVHDDGNLTVEIRISKINTELAMD